MKLPLQRSIRTLQHIHGKYGHGSGHVTRRRARSFAPTPPFSTAALPLPRQPVCCRLLPRLWSRRLLSCPEVLCQRAGHRSAARHGCRDAARAALPHHPPTDADALLSYCAAWHLSPSFRGFVTLTTKADSYHG